MRIRLYDPNRDQAALRACFIALQDHEHDFASESPTGAEIVDAYLAWMFDRCEEHEGKVLVAELNDQVVGFATVLCRVHRDEPDDPDDVSANLTELSVLPEYRAHGVGKALLVEGERLAREAGVPCLRIQVDARNEGARRLYDRFGFLPMAVLMEKRLA